ncbi:unnamed protein product [Brugia pahangi]|uniref:Ribonuclease P n=1 Tax=Brugia pahangi TaxID=6280 RepID=A0A0N4T0M1_BRUPA|nr:unnamed protein product [Brugia pahangi]
MLTTVTNNLPSMLEEEYKVWLFYKIEIKISSHESVSLKKVNRKNSNSTRKKFFSRLLGASTITHLYRIFFQIHNRRLDTSQHDELLEENLQQTSICFVSTVHDISACRLHLLLKKIHADCSKNTSLNCTLCPPGLLRILTVKRINADKIFRVKVSPFDREIDTNDDSPVHI